MPKKESKIKDKTPPLLSSDKDRYDDEDQEEDFYTSKLKPSQEEFQYTFIQMTDKQQLMKQ